MLGDAKTFKLEFEKRITAGNDKDATGRDRQIAAAKAAELRARIAPFFLRREKKDVLPSNDSNKTSSTEEATASSSQHSSQAPQPQSMGHKNDLIVWLQLHPAQRHVYEAFLESSAVRAALNKTGSALAALTVLKKICDHPRLLNERAASLVARTGGRLAKVKADSNGSDEEEEEWFDASEEVKEEAAPSGGSWWEQGNVDAADVEAHLLKDIHGNGVGTSCKTEFIMGLLAELVAKGHRTLIFSQSRVMLDILQAAISEQSYAYCRIDGSISSATDRQALVQEFQTRDDIPVFLLTSQVGGLGLTLTAADRVIIVDPAWNPSVDNQSVDRAYRIGQRQDVVVYRLITCGTVEEKIYKKQVFKGGLSRSGTEEGVAFRYFSQQDLRDLFRVVPSELEKSETQQTLDTLHADQRKATNYVRDHLDFLQTLPRYAGVSDHDLMFSKKAEDSGMDRKESWPEPIDSRHAALPPSSAAARQRKAPASGWSGSSDISDMLANTLHLGGPGPPKAATNSQGPFVRPGTQATAASSTAAPPAASRLERLQKDISSLKRIISSSSSASLPDGGAKLHQRMAALRQELAQLQPTVAGSWAAVGQEQCPAGLLHPASSLSNGTKAVSASSASSVSHQEPIGLQAQAVVPVAEQPSLSRQDQLGTSASSHRQHAQDLQSTTAAMHRQRAQNLHSNGSGMHRQPVQDLHSTSSGMHRHPAQDQLDIMCGSTAAMHRQPAHNQLSSGAAMHRQHAQDLHSTSSGMHRQPVQDQLDTSVTVYKQPGQDQLNSSTVSHRQPAQAQSGTGAAMHQQSAQNLQSITQHPLPVQLASNSLHSHQRQGHRAPSMSPAQSGGVAKAQLSSGAAGRQVQQLTLQIKQMKKTMIEYASLLDDPQWKQQQPDGGKAVLAEAKAVRDKREALKARVQAVQAADQ